MTNLWSTSPGTPPYASLTWLHNGQVSGDNETGAYTLPGGTATPTNAATITRNLGAVVWLPTYDEWYKAAYYDAIAKLCYPYPTGTNMAPNNNLPSGDTGKSASFFNDGYTTSVLYYPMTDVGAYADSGSPYGTFDQGGHQVSSAACAAAHIMSATS